MLKRLKVGHAYLIDGLEPDMWAAPHPVHRMPTRLAGKYIGCMSGERCWHGFEIWIDGQESGVVFMNEQDVDRLSITPIEGD